MNSNIFIWIGKNVNFDVVYAVFWISSTWNNWKISYLPANEGVMAFVCGLGETNPDELWLEVDAFRWGDECWVAWFWKLLKCWCWGLVAEFVIAFPFWATPDCIGWSKQWFFRGLFWRWFRASSDRPVWTSVLGWWLFWWYVQPTPFGVFSIWLSSLLGRSKLPLLWL